jgi:hypothetical protein
MWEVMTAYVIMHNMIVKEECDDSVYDQWWDFQGELVARNLDWLLSRIFSMHIMIFKTGQHTTPSMKIL